jgi:hypothetical protein
MSRTLLLALLLSTLPAVYAKPPTKPLAEPDESALIEHGHYVNKSGQTVHAPAHTKGDQAPAGASAKCRDGSYSFSRNHRGTCSRHAGVAQWLS